MTLQSLLGCTLPLIQAPMAGSHNHTLTAAVCNAGGLGSLACALFDASALRLELEALTRKTTQPFNLNFFCHTPPRVDAARDAAWRTALRPYYAELDIDPASISSGPGRLPFSAEMADVLDEFRPAVVSFHFGLPAAELLARVKACGAKVLSSATTVEEARWLEAHGADAIIAQGLEAGGHRGMFLSEDLNRQLGTFALLPQIVQAVQVPVIAAGGIADAQGVRAAMALGASGVQVGTAYLCCDEASTSAIHRAALLSPAAQHTALTNLFSGRPARGIVNRVMRELGPISPLAPAFPLATSAIAPLRSQAESQGSGDFSPLWAGQNTRGCQAIGAAELTAQLAQGFTH
ncbi:MULTISPECIES: NAD(P)H-dependent flavin oxidoreductase [Pseudomonas]|uniref:Propionate 3-nitronate monooxygenase n=1 Tax=Pseudomonas spirodelae TaxID=3101751 RepID=A0ABU5PAJ6_9PSED|nr:MULTISPECIES: nitronate monooxygenase [unclassified Pseudomonas]MDD2162009.1 nitronate monooxygenase [Pseudomonas sp. MIL19]MEA1606568.1 nitronate monooxygenase [Pseudomonas sp. T5W1]